MRRRAFLATAGAAATGGCLSGIDAPRSDAGGTTTGSVVDRRSIRMDGYSSGGGYWFDPVGLHVPPGTTVTWRCRRGGPHSATAYPDRIPGEADAFDTGLLARGQAREHRFAVEGTYDYYCLPHEGSGMVARIVCGDPGDPPEGPTPGGPVPDVGRIVETGRVGVGEFDGEGTGSGR